MFKPLRGIAISACILLAPALAHAAIYTVDFGTGSNVVTSWPGSSNASNSTTGVVLTSPLVIAGGALQIMTSPDSSLFCAQGLTAGTCGSSTGLTNSTAYGLGVGNGRIDPGELLSILVNPGFTAVMISFSFTGFGSSQLQEVAYYVPDCGCGTILNAPFFNFARDSYTVNIPFVEGFTFGSLNGNFSLARITVDVAEVPEPAAIGLVGAGLLALGFYRRKRK